tara:strand:- start:1797 stop:2687 length:891 start_codon:yes stop_codon:yes gene_type:complete
MIRHFVDIDNFSKKTLDKILDNALRIKKNNTRYKNILQNKTLALLFNKKSLRTRMSFNVGMQKLGGNVIQLNSDEIGFGERESEEDILKTISQYVDCLMIRNNDHKKINYYASLNILPIINGLSNMSHPCQILSDIFTLKEKFEKISKIKICWIGDYNNVLRSLIHAQNLYLFKLNIVLPKKILNKVKTNKKINKKIFFTDNIKIGVTKSDCIMTDVWLSMGEKNKSKKIHFKKYQINKKIIELANKGAVFMHCLPAHRGEEVTNEVIDSKQSIIWQQAQNRMYVQQAILSYILNK